MNKSDLLIYLKSGPYLEPFVEPLKESGFQVVMGDFLDENFEKCWALFPGRSYVTPELLDKAKNVKAICKIGVGLDRINIPAATERNILVFNTPKSNGVSVAEHAMGLMLAAAKHFYPISLYTRNDYPEFTCTTRYRASELYGKTVVVVGVGNIGTIVARLCNAFGMRVIGVDPFIEHEGMPDYIEWATLEEALPQADFVTMHVSARHENDKMMSYKQFGLMKSTAVFVNTSRGFVVDEDALYEALTTKGIAAAGLDVFQTEPWQPFNRLRRLENLICTPHSAANTSEARVNGRIEACRLINEYAEGKMPYSAANVVPMWNA